MLVYLFIFLVLALVVYFTLKGGKEPEPEAKQEPEPPKPAKPAQTAPAQPSFKQLKKGAA
eukprot:CAMPEP_0202961118 /NCGR_PEP_ID=MMETSP1396-20130829/5190_1 /ASSEMBLY_ACC=CAM_ASM_000872 /TAXON_ID= /ORGANISM="Pseudokeronopsis sp., Strain Brazil" /LENGTH=59 /DNA_ID=CAMNT_0049680723 /DNA_START=1 /DNA_END=180 /DNA_ORIENTATION=-